MKPQQVGKRLSELIESPRRRKKAKPAKKKRKKRPLPWDHLDQREMADIRRCVEEGEAIIAVSRRYNLFPKHIYAMIRKYSWQYEFKNPEYLAGSPAQKKLSEARRQSLARRRADASATTKLKRSRDAARVQRRLNAALAEADLR